MATNQMIFVRSHETVVQRFGSDLHVSIALYTTNRTGKLQRYEASYRLRSEFALRLCNRPHRRNGKSKASDPGLHNASLFGV